MAKSELKDWGRAEYKRSHLGELVRGKYANLSEADQEKVESEYRRMKPTDFDEAMSRAKLHAQQSIRLSTRSSPKRKN